MSVVVEPMTQAEREAEKQDAAMEIGRLGIQIKLLEPEAKKDSVIQAELDDLIAARTAAESRLHELLGQEREERLAADAAAAEAEERRQGRLARARSLGAERVAAAGQVDQVFRQAAIAVVGYDRICKLQQDELTAEKAIELPVSPPSTVKPLIAADPVAIEPAGDKS